MRFENADVILVRISVPESTRSLVVKDAEDRCVRPKRSIESLRNIEKLNMVRWLGLRCRAFSERGTCGYAHHIAKIIQMLGS